MALTPAFLAVWSMPRPMRFIVPMRVTRTIYLSSSNSPRGSMEVIFSSGSVWRRLTIFMPLAVRELSGI